MVDDKLEVLKLFTGRIDRVDDRINSLEHKFDNKIDDLKDNVNTKFDSIRADMGKNHLDLLDRIEPLNNFKYKIIGAVLVISIVLPSAISYLMNRAVKEEKIKITKITKLVGV